MRQIEIVAISLVPPLAAAAAPTADRIDKQPGHILFYYALVFLSFFFVMSSNGFASCRAKNKCFIFSTA